MGPAPFLSLSAERAAREPAQKEQSALRPSLSLYTEPHMGDARCLLLGWTDGREPTVPRPGS